MIVEGLNVLQTRPRAGRRPRRSCRDFFDFSIYVDATSRHPRSGTSTGSSTSANRVPDPKSYFHRYAALSDDEAVETARRIWRESTG